MLNKTVFAVLSSSILSFAILFFVQTATIKVAYSIFTFMLTSLFLLLIIDSKATKCFKTKSYCKADLFKIVYLTGFLASICILAIPLSDLVIYGNSIIASLLDFFITARIISGYFLVSILPGIFIYKILLEDKIILDAFEKAGFILAFSYCYTLLVGGLLLFFKCFSPTTFVIVVWIFITAITLWSHYKNKLEGEESYSMQHHFSLDLNSIMLFTTLMWWVLFAYQTTLFIRPMSGYMRWDPTENIAYANEAANFGLFVRGAYTGNHFWWILGSIMGLPMHYAFATFQFMTIIPILSFYTLVRALFPNKREVAIVSTVFVCFLTGMTSLYMFFSTKTLGMYLSEDTINALNDYWVMIRGPDALPGYVSPYCFDVSLVLLALSLSYRYLTSSRNYSRFLIISGLFIAIAFVVHSLNYLPTFFGTIILFLLLRTEGLSSLLKFIAVPLIFIFALDPIFGWFLTTQIFLRVHDIRLFGLLPLLLGMLIILFVICRKVALRLSHKLRQLVTLIQRNKVFFWILGFSTFIFAVISYYKNFQNLSYSSIQSNNLIAPWYFYIVKYFGIAFPLSVGSIPILIQMAKRDSLFFLISWFIGSLVMIPFMWVFPQDFPAHLFFTRSIRNLSYPISILAALSLLFIFRKSPFLSKNEHKRKKCQLNIRATRKIVCTFIVVSLILPYTSRALLVEFLYTNGQQQAVPEEVIKCINWINKNLPRDADILPLSVGSYNILTNLVYERPILPIFFKFSPTWLQYSWLRDILLKSLRPEAVLYILHKVGVNYIFTTENDISNLKKEFSNSSFLTMLNFFPVAYESRSGKYKVFAVPKYPLYQDSNYVLVHPTLNDALSFNRAFNVLLRFSVNFSVIDGLDLKELKKDYVYIFPSNLSCADPSNFLTDVSNGSHVIVIFDGTSLHFNGTVDEVKIYRREMQHNASKVVFKDGYTVYLDNKVTVLNFSLVEDAEVLASYEIDGNLTIPFIIHKRIGSGTITFLNMPLQGLSLLNNADLIQHILNMLKKELPIPKPCNTPLLLPYSQDILRYVKPHILSLRFTEDLHRTILFYDDTVVNGEISLNSNFLYVPYLPTKNMSVRTDEVAQRLGEVAIYNFSIKGDVKLHFLDSIIKIQSKGSGSKINVFLKSYTQFNLIIKNAELYFNVEGHDPPQRRTCQNVNVTIEPTSNLTLIIEQPSMELRGAITGIMQGAMLCDSNFYYTPSKESNYINGELTLQIMYDSGIIYAKIMKIKQLNFTNWKLG